MRYIRIENSGRSRPTNPLMQVLGFIVGCVMFAVAVFIGGLVIAAFIGFLLVAGLVIYARIWWLTRKAGLRSRKDDFVEAEYEIIDTSANDDNPR